MRAFKKRFLVVEGKLGSIEEMMSKLLEDAYDPELFRKNGHRVVDMLADYLADVKKGEGLKVLEWEEPGEKIEKWRHGFLESRPGEQTMERFCADVIENSIHLHHPKNMGHQVSAPAPAAALVELIGAFLNNSMAVYEVGPFSTAVETLVIEWLGAGLGMPKGCGGILTSGGSIGNLTALLAARQSRAGFDTWEKGANPSRPLAVMVSSESHYSVARAVKIMGWGEQGIIKIPLNSRLEIDHTALEETYRRAVDEGKHVIALVANACSTSTGSYDPLNPLAEFCSKKDLWFHVDAAHGGGVVFTSRYKHLVDGIDKADSVVIDFHKMFLCPSLATAVVFKDGDHAYETFSQKASYLLSPEKRGRWFDIAQRTLECTKKMMGIKIYALLKLYGVRLFDDYITRMYDLARRFAEMIKSSPSFQLALEPASNIVCFRYVPHDGMDVEPLNRVNAHVREELKKDGEFYIVQTMIHDELYLRTTLMNPLTSERDLEQLLERIRSLIAA